MLPISSYQQALDYIYSFIDPARRPAATPAEAEQHLTKVRALLAAVGEPQAAMAAVVVAGTKGKGSTCAMIEAVARAAGLRTGLWSSPHLSSYRERMQVDRQPIAQDELVALLNRIHPAIEGFDHETYGRPSTFDIGFVLALSYFAARKVELAVLEVGLGGRYDAVNVITPLVAAISSISYDHMHVLGSTLAAIADNKAGIMKPGVPAVTAIQPPEAAAVVERVAAEVGAPLWTATATGLLPATGGPLLPYPLPPLPRLRGAVQRENARVAVGAAMLLRAHGLPISDDAIARALAEVEWPGRLEVVASAPTIVLDGAHNGDSAQRLAAALREEFSFARLVLVLGTSRDKDVAAIVRALVPAADALVLTRSAHPRAQADLDWLASAALPHLRAGTPSHFAPDVAAALALARSIAEPRDLVCVTGSLFVVGAAREALGLAVAD